MSDETSERGARVSLVGVTRRYRQGNATVTAVDDVTLDIEPGQTLALTGPSGSGKSSLLHLIGALERPDQGEVVVDGVALHTLSRRAAARHRAGVGLIFQNYRLLATLSAADNVLLPVLPLRVDFDKRARARELLDAVGLAAVADVPAEQLSGGQRQRVAVARALVNRPRLLLADEPTGSLDSRTGEDLLDLLADVQQAHGMTMVLATHDPAVAAQCGRLVRLRDGAVVDDHRLDAPDSDAMLRRVTGPG
ncbi:ABC transporter ATP-binding protein [Dactylosporangium sp. CA-233914]|uniref:ABC transporter ATP-binding protein n=1 Tax=Dactylosporangium sp. CA-233914 TaxID=3239934 RepID=UPI003D8FCA6D